MSKGILRKINAARKAIHSEVGSRTVNGNIYTRGLAYEGYAGGYLQALSDVTAALLGNPVSHDSRYWPKEEKNEAKM